MSRLLFRLTLVNWSKQTICLIIFCVFGIAESKAQFYPKKKDFRMGISFGMSPSRTIGSELKNARFSNGIQSGIYFRSKINKNTNYELGFNAALRGSAYKHSKDDQYNQLSLVVLEIPLWYMIDVGSEKETQFLILGAIPSRIAQSEFYIIPEQTARDEFRNVGLKRTDLAVAAGYHINTYYLGWRFSAQYGLINLNNGLNLQDIEPSTGNGEKIGAISLNVQVYF